MVNFYLVQMPQLRLPDGLESLYQIKGRVDGLCGVCISNDIITNDLIELKSLNDAQDILNNWAVDENNNAEVDIVTGEKPIQISLNLLSLYGENNG